MQTGAAVVTEVGQIVRISTAKLEATGHSRKNRTEALAVAAGVTDLHLSRHFRFSGRTLADQPGCFGQGLRLAG
jgi:hypothetical protein